MQIYPVPAFQDNYLWVLTDTDSSQAAVVDPGDAVPVLAFLARHSLQLQAILVTHHHADHIGGISTLLSAFPEAVVYGPDTSRIPQVTHAVCEGSQIRILGRHFRVLEVPGHTLEHIAYVSEPDISEPDDTSSPALFCGDTLFAGGCGRMFEGTPPMMQASLQKLANLPPDTAVYCAHEYTLGNLRFANAVMPDNQALQQRQVRDTATRANNLPTVPSTIATELATNPFLRCNDLKVVEMAGQVEPLPSPDPASVFGILRRWKDRF